MNAGHRGYSAAGLGFELGHQCTHDALDHSAIVCMTKFLMYGSDSPCRCPCVTAGHNGVTMGYQQLLEWDVLLPPSSSR